MHVRGVLPSDLASMYQAAAGTAWEQLMPDQRAVARPEQVASNAAQMIYQTLTHPGGGAVVADSAGKVVGYLLYRIGPGELTGEPEGYFLDIWVDPTLRRQGLGQTLVQAAESMVCQAGARRVQLMISGTNIPSLTNARRTGYQLERVLLGKPLPSSVPTVVAGVTVPGT